MRFVKVKRGGERFWARVLTENADGSMRARCDNDTVDPLAPKFRDEFDIASDEEIFEQRIVGRREFIRAVPPIEDETT